MSTPSDQEPGSEAGELGAANDAFFGERRLAAFFKHAVLKRYVAVFAAAAASVTPGRRAVLLDGYAGPGMYGDGSPGSPQLLLTAQEMSGSYSSVHCVFVDTNPDHVQALSRLVAEAGATGSCTILEGDIAQHLDRVIEDARGRALLAFLDPYSMAVDDERFVNDVLNRPGQAPTEAIVHFSMETVRRIGGLLSTDGDHEVTIARVDRALGGVWWREVFTAARAEAGNGPNSATAAAYEVARAWCERVRERTGMGWFIVPVHERPELSPRYLLLFFSGHSYGTWRFVDAASKAREEWLEEVGSVRGALFAGIDPEPTKAELIDRVAANIEAILGERDSFRPDRMVGAVYGDSLGIAREMHVRGALKKLKAGGVVRDEPVGHFERSLVRRA